MSSSSPSMFPTKPYQARHTSFPYTAADFQRADTSSDGSFYFMPRFVTHIDDAAISGLQSYYSSTLPRKGRILDLCSSWISHFPSDLAARATATAEASDQSAPSTASSTGAASQDRLEVVGVGMNNSELKANPILSKRIVRDLNITPELTSDDTGGVLDAVTCVVSIDYLTQPMSVLQSVKRQMRKDATVHLVISNRCFPTKAIGRWLRVSEDERLQMVGDYLHFTGFTNIETVTVRDGKRSDPLWVVRGVNSTEGEG